MVQSLFLTRSRLASESTAIESGPASMPEGASASLSESQARTAALSFIPNAGAIWTDPVTKQTHLLALQLPGIPGSRQIEWASLDTGWQGSKFMTMDWKNFYVVWHNAVFRIPKSSPNTWSLLIPNNGEEIKGIVGSQASSVTGGYLLRGYKLYRFDATNQIVTQLNYNSNVTLASSVNMAGYFKQQGQGQGINLFFVSPSSSSSNLLWRYVTSSGSWSNLNQYTTGYEMLLVGNPMSNLLYQYQYRIEGIHRKIVALAPESGSTQVFSTLQFTAPASMAVNNGYLWVFDHTFRQLMTLGSNKGLSAYNEGGWQGVSLSCADPFLVFN